MNLKNVCACLLWLVVLYWPRPVVGQEPPDETEFVIADFRLETLPAGSLYPNFFENLAPDAVWLSEESNGFGLLDQPRVYFEGDSWTQFDWHYAGHAIGSALDDGAPAVQVPVLAIGAMALRSETPRRRGYGFYVSPRSPQRTVARLMLSTAGSGLGGYLGLGKLAVANHASMRAEDLYYPRRRIAGSYQLDFSFEKKSRLSSLLLAIGYFNLSRRFNDFNRRDSQFEEEGDMLQLLARWQRPSAQGTLTLDLVVNAGRRDRLFAETGRYPQETYLQDKRSWLAAADWAGRPCHVKLSWLQEWQQRRPAVEDAGKDLMDIDGQAFFPFEKWGRFTAATLALAADKAVALAWLGRKAMVEPYLDLSAVFLSAAEKTGTLNEIYFAGKPYQALRWQGGGDYRNQRRSAAAGARFEMELSRSLSFAARAFGQYQGLDFRTAGNDRGFLQPGGEAGLTLLAGKGTRISLSYGNLPYDLGAGVSDFLEDQRPGYILSDWNDRNDDGRFQSDEQGDRFGRGGGPSHAAGDDLRPSRRERLSLFASTRLSTHFNLHVKGLLKKIRRPLWVRFSENYGHYQNVKGVEYYLLDDPYRAFELGNAPFAKDPFYAQFLLQVEGEKARRWYFSFSFMAHMGMGNTAFGNGPEANDVGVISESQAFPNSWINGFGRVDGDRAFMGKVFFGYHLSPRLFLSSSIKYRDGDPFAFFKAFKLQGQWVIAYQTIKGEDEQGKKGGPREDCIWDFNFKLGYDLKLFGRKARLELSLFNLLDFGGELSENVFSDESQRLANELQLPRSLRLGIVLEL